MSIATTPDGERYESLEIDAALWREVLTFLTACLPNEGVGLLSTRDDRGGIRGFRFYPGRNLNESPSRFTMDPVDVLRACEDMEREGTRLGAVVHSHPLTAPEPSRTDLQELALPGVLSLIVQMSPQVRARAWEITPAEAVEVPFRSLADVSSEGRRV